MSNAIWPPGLPQCLEYGYREELPDDLIRTDMEYGPAKVRRRTTVGAGKINGSVVLTRAQAATFDTFMDSSIAGGALAFTWTHPRTGADVLFRFAEMPSLAQISPNRWRLSMSLEILPTVTEPPE